MKKFFRTLTNKWLLKGTTTVILVAIVIACYIGANWGISKLKIEDLDFTTKKLYSLSDTTKKRLDELENEITIQLINLSNSYYLEYATKYEIASDKVKIEKVENLSERLDLQTKYNIKATDTLVVIKNGEKEQTLRLDDFYTYDYSTREQIDRTEEAITNAIMKVTIAEEPKIYVLTGKTYSVPQQSLATIASTLESEANDVESLDILSTGNVPEDCKCLVITTLKQDINELERDKIIEYINRGGKILMLTSQNIMEVNTPNFNQVLAQYGISMGFGAVFEQDSSKMLQGSPELVIADVEADFLSDIGMFLKICMVDAGKIEFADEEKLKELGVTYETIAKTSDKSFVRTKFNTSTDSRTDNDSEEGENIVAARVSKTITNENSSELIIYSSEFFASNMQVAIGTQYYTFAVELYNNKDVVLNSIAYLSDREDTIMIRKTNEVENYTVTDQEDVIIKTIIFVIPVIIIAIGIAVWVYRKRRV